MFKPKGFGRFNLGLLNLLLELFEKFVAYFGIEGIFGFGVSKECFPLLTLKWSDRKLNAVNILNIDLNYCERRHKGTRDSDIIQYYHC